MLYLHRELAISNATSEAKMQPPTKSEDVLTILPSFLKEDAEVQTWLLERVFASTEILQKCLASQLEEKERLERELEIVEKRKAAMTVSLNEVKYLMRREKMQTKLKERKRRATQEALDLCLEDLPPHYRREMRARIAAVQPRVSSSSSSNVEVEGTTDSARSSSSYVTSVSVSSVTPEFSAEESDLEGAFDKRISSSTESERSSTLLFSSMVEAFKRRQHSFRDRCFILGNKCFVCDKKFVCGRKELECRDCQAAVHKRCQDRLSPPCVPAKKVYLRKVGPGPEVAVFCCAGFRPQIPAFVVHCVLTVEESGLSEPSLYVLPDYSHKTAALKQRLENDGFLLNLSRLKTSTVCELLKHFLGQCTRPLVNASLYAEFETFVTTAGVVNKSKNDHKDLAQFHDVMLKAPEADRATLCTLILHLKKVCESAECRVSTKSMAKTWAPILLRNFDAEAAFNEKKQKYEVVRKLLKLPDNLYEYVLKELF